MQRKISHLFFSILLTALMLPLEPATVHGYTSDDDEEHEVIADDSVAVGSWATKVIARVLASQTGAQNWVEDGANTLNSTLQFDINAKRISSSWVQNHESRFAMGVVKQDTLDFRKASDEIRLKSSFRYKGGGFFENINPTIATDFSTQFAAGFNYKSNPFGDDREGPVKVSGFFAPATFTQSLGLTFTTKESFQHRVGFGAKQTIVSIERIRPLYNLEADQSTRFEMGFESRTQVNKEVFENVHVKSSLGLFAAFNKSDVPDMLWENQVNMKINKWLGVNMEFKALYDRDITRELQLRESFSLGVVYSIV